jgi:hypothetical protein
MSLVFDGAKKLTGPWEYRLPYLSRCSILSHSFTSTYSVICKSDSSC